MKTRAGKLFRWRKSAPFTLIEMLIVVAVLGFLLGLTLPSLHRALFKAKYVRWLAYNYGLNADPYTILNFNFRDIVNRANENGIIKSAVLNTSTGCGVEGFDPVKYDGHFKNNVEIKERYGRWAPHNSASKFNGFDGYIEIPGKEAFNTQAGLTDFTISLWCNFDTLSGRQVLASRSIWNLYSTFALYLDGRNIVLEAGSSDISFTPTDLVAGKWVHIAAVGSGESGIKLFYNGRLVGSQSYGNSGGKIVVWHVPPGHPESARLIVVGASAWNGLQHQEGSYIVSTDPEAYFRGAYKDAMKNAPVIIGAANMSEVPSPQYFFKGRIDELVLSCRVYKTSEIFNHYRMGNPY